MNTPQQAITNLFIATDQRNWQWVEQLFDKEVHLDYTSMTRQAATTLNPEQIIAAWKTILPGFEHTHHQLGNFIPQEDGNKGSVFCYGTATHFLPDEGGNIWTVVGTYDFDLVKSQNGTWKINSMKFNFKYQDGNTALPKKAIQILKEQ